jgi:hypothetical protein
MLLALAFLERVMGARAGEESVCFELVYIHG